MTWHNQIVILKQQLQQLAAVIGSGLIQAIKPFVIQMNAALSGLIKFAQNVVNALGKIFGWEMEVNTKGLTIDDDALEDIDTSGLDNIGDSADNATKSVKKLKDQLQGFDKLNVLRTTTTNPNSKKSDSGNGSGASGAGAVSNGDVTAGLKKTKGLFESNIDNLFDLGEYIANTISKKLEDIEWEKVYEKARKFGTGLASFLNGLFTGTAGERLFKNLGSSIAGAINTVLNAADAFADKFNFTGLGKNLGSGLTEFLTKLDWKTALSAAKNWGKGIGDAIAGFVKKTDFELVGKTIANAIKTQVTFWLSLGSSIPWKDIGKGLADTINGAVKNFPAKDFANTINVWVQGIHDLFVSLLKNIKWEDVAKTIKDIIKNLDMKTISIIVKTLALIKGASLVVTIGSAILSAVAKKFVESLAISILAEMSSSTILSKVIGKGLATAGEQAAGAGFFGTASAGIVGTFASIVGAIGGAVLAVKGLFDIWTKGWSTARGIMVAAGSGIAIAIGLVVGVLTGPLALAIAGAVGAIAFLGANWGKIKDGIASKVGELIKSFDALKSDFGKTKSDIGKQFAGMKNDFATMTTGIIQKGKTLASDVTGSFTSVKTNAGGAVNILVSVAKTQFESMRSDLASKMSSIKSNATEKWGSIKNTISQYASSAKNTVTSVWGTLKTDTTSAWSTIKSKTTEVWSSIKSAITDKVSSAKTAVKNAIDKIKGYFKFSWSLPKLKMPHPYVSGSFSLNPPSVPTFGIEWYKKAYDNPFMFTKPTLMPDIKGFGDGNGGEMVYGHANLMNDIREASGSNEMTNIGNRQLANDQRIIQLLTVIAEKEFGISADSIYSVVKEKDSDFFTRSGKSAFSY